MRLLYLSGSGAMGGAERVLLDMILGMQARGHQIKLILGEHGPLQSRVAGAGVVALHEAGPSRSPTRTGRSCLKPPTSGRASSTSGPCSTASLKW